MDQHSRRVSSLPLHFQAIETIFHQQDEGERRHPNKTGMTSLVRIHATIIPSPSWSSRLLERRPKGYSFNDWANRGQDRIFSTLGDGSGAWGDSEDEAGFGAADYDPFLLED